MKSVVTLPITESKCIREFSIFLRWVEFHPIAPPPLSLLQPRQPRLDLPLDREECHEKFGNASYYRDQMHKEQTDILLYILDFTCIKRRLYLETGSKW
jgi:hypothetical protein